MILQDCAVGAGSYFWTTLEGWIEHGVAREVHRVFLSFFFTTL